MTMNDEEANALREPFPKSVIGKLPKAGKQLDYVGHAAVCDRLLKVDPGWTWEPAGVDQFGIPVFDKSGGLWIKLTVCGVTRYGYGNGSGIEAVKIAIGDAIRNAAMRFGVALDLWSKEELNPVEEGERPFRPAQTADDPWQLPPSEVPVAEVMAGAMQTQRGAGTTQPASKKQIGLIGAMMTDRKMRDHDQALAFVNRTINTDPPITSRNDLTKAQASKVIEALDLIPIPTEPDWQD